MLTSVDICRKRPHSLDGITAHSLDAITAKRLCDEVVAMLRKPFASLSNELGKRMLASTSECPLSKRLRNSDLISQRSVAGKRTRVSDMEISAKRRRASIVKIFDNEPDAMCHSVDLASRLADCVVFLFPTLKSDKWRRAVESAGGTVRLTLPSQVEHHGGPVIIIARPEDPTEMFARQLRKKNISTSIYSVELLNEALTSNCLNFDRHRLTP